MMVPSSGRATLAGFDVGTQSGQVRRHIGVVFQSQSLDKKLTVEENLRAQGHLFGLSGTTLQAAARRVMERLGLAERRGDLVQSLSGGLRRRVEVAKALLHEPQGSADGRALHAAWIPAPAANCGSTSTTCVRGRA